MSAQPPNQITVDPKDPEQALALLNHIARTFQADAATHDAIRQAVETLKGSIEDQRTDWKLNREAQTEWLAAVGQLKRLAEILGFDTVRLTSDASAWLLLRQGEEGPAIEDEIRFRLRVLPETNIAPGLETSRDDRLGTAKTAQGKTRALTFDGRLVKGLSPASGSAGNPEPIQPEFLLFNCPTHGESKIPLPPAGETFTPACQKCIEASLGICATHPEKGLHAKEDSCRSWIPSRSQQPAHF